MYSSEYCDCYECPFKECVRHLSHLEKESKKKNKYVTLVNFASVCRAYLSYVLEEVEKENKRNGGVRVEQQNMIYTSKRGKQIVFDDFVDNTKEYQSCWVEMCPKCHNKHKGILGNRAHHGAMGTCSVLGCENEADYYVDFAETEIEIVNEKDGAE